MNSKLPEETDFQNDPVADWVLNSGDKPAEQAEEKDCWFPIHFNFKGVYHTADVLKTERAVVEYHVTSVQPILDHLPDPFIISSTFSKGVFDFPVNEDYYPRELGHIMVTAIDNGCNRADVALA